MKIDEFIVKPYSVPFLTPMKNSGTTYTHREGVWLQLMRGNKYGYGEAAPLPNFSSETLKEVYYALESFHQAIDGELMEKDEFFSLIDVHSQEVPSAKFAIETALYDLFSKEEDKPLFQYINPNANGEISINGIAGVHTPEDNYKVIKVKVGFNNIFDEIERLELLKESFGNDILFRLDANGAFDLPRAIRFCKEMEAFHIDYIEQPLPHDALIDLAELCYHTNIPIAVDESLTNFRSAERIIEEQAAQIFIIKPMVSGGFSETKKIINLAKKENIRTVVTSSLETAIGRMACLHLVAANEIKETCGLATGELLSEKIKTPNIKNSIIKLPSISGLGLSL